MKTRNPRWVRTGATGSELWLGGRAADGTYGHVVQIADGRWQAHAIRHSTVLCDTERAAKLYVRRYGQLSFPRSKS